MCDVVAFMNPLEVLHIHDLKRTACREGILSIMLESQQALSENEIRNQLSENFDRTTFYRSFKTLIEKSIIHKIVVDNLVVKYALDNSLTMRRKHAHFYCLKCDSVICLDNVPYTEPEIPNGFKAIETEVIIKGFCSNCK